MRVVKEDREGMVVLTGCGGGGGVGKRNLKMLLVFDARRICQHLYDHHLLSPRSAFHLAEFSTHYASAKDSTRAGRLQRRGTREDRVFLNAVQSTKTKQ
jgi:hypothetical protein